MSGGCYPLPCSIFQIILSLHTRIKIIKMAVFGLSSLPKYIANFRPGDYLVRGILYHKIGKMQLGGIRNDFEMIELKIIGDEYICARKFKFNC